MNYTIYNIYTTRHGTVVKSSRTNRPGGDVVKSTRNQWEH